MIVDGDVFVKAYSSHSAGHEPARAFVHQLSVPVGIVGGIELQILEAILRDAWWGIPLDGLLAASIFDNVFDFTLRIREDGMLVEFPRTVLHKGGFILAASTDLSWETACAVVLAQAQFEPLVVLDETQRDRIQRQITGELHILTIDEATT